MSHSIAFVLIFFPFIAMTKLGIVAFFNDLPYSLLNWSASKWCLTCLLKDFCLFGSDVFKNISARWSYTNQYTSFLYTSMWYRSAELNSIWSKIHLAGCHWLKLSKGGNNSKKILISLNGKHITLLLDLTTGLWTVIVILSNS